MIRFILLQNRQGKTRLAKWYVDYDEQEKQKLQGEINRIIVYRDRKHTNFLEFRNYKIIYKRYAGLFFSICVDTTDNELTYLEMIHLFVEVLDSYFSNVRELDIVYNFHKAFGILDEMIIGGEIMETSKSQILAALRQVELLE
ncbi:clathrin assembly small subunit protein (macronuclear) [Tetrahymena thermophila SB210]|uniref:AP complex subunit sigma n=1 Tax=Tetrahymena thermophila (strain SB210) TaxID=312017 RepID=I7MJG2_TETTS|nr:clathrin assembly small subunit protein [Tetrahymena thermophila SB210]EAS06245.2 clathrin assembly small subunit protein [Tetrahymena thermophila SB210]|eukprot:XP_001026490.2 clathrin assembly small subunit protein [Tetrahymena thermophila SB210]